jgi:predicted RNase H-like HicB family nuclease
MKFLVVIEKGKHNYSAYSPDVLGCVATGKTVEATLENMKNALEFHIEGMLESGEKMPIPKSLNYYISETEEISYDEIIAHVDLEFSGLALA